ncbi:hypothetical protein [Rhodococcus rhodochrous]|uniref:hypothetical protein n=1 Tax=Rhodococcus rhodochrous TaxID=1829 RepID=UPI0013520A1B|nr:hypothetical protein [Rhodococcus rhodochrous]
MKHLSPELDAYQFDANRISTSDDLISVQEQRARVADTLVRLDEALTEMAAELEGGIA